MASIRTAFPFGRRALVATSAVLLALAPAIAQARTYVIPHVLERSGTISNTQYTFDTTIFATYTPGLAGLPAGSGASIDLYLFDNTGQPMRNNAQDVCAPCSFPLGGNQRKQSIRVDDLILARGAFDTPVKLGFGVLVVGGDDPDGVHLQSFVEHAHTSAFDLETTPIGPQELGHLCAGETPAGGTQRAYSFPHVFEKSGRISNTQFTFDTTIFATYSGGLAGIPTGPTGSATVDLYLLDDEGQPFVSAGGQNVCAPCTYVLGGSARKASINLEQEFDNRGGMPANVVSGFAVAVVSGESENVNLQGFVYNAHTGPFDLALAALDPRSIPENSLIEVPAAGPALDGAMRITPNPARAGAALAFTLARTMDVELAIYDVGGRKVAQVWSGRREAGAQSLPWDGRLEGGTLAPAGVYFARLSGEGVLLQNRVIALR